MYLDYLAGALELIGIWVIGNKNKNGYIIFIACGICWMAYTIVTKSTFGLWMVIIPSIILNTRNYKKWKKEENE